jgi:hypothetical protein
MSDVGPRDGIKANVLDVVNLDRHAPGQQQPTPGHCYAGSPCRRNLLDMVR